MSIFFTSDLHIYHDKDFVYAARGFSSIEEHNMALIKNWNETVSPEDTVYCMGDMIMGAEREKALEYLRRLNGTIIFVRGNHDTDSKFNDYLSKCPNISIESQQNEYGKMLKVGKHRYYMCHWPTLMGDVLFGNKKGRLPVTVCLHGHTHSKDRFEYIKDGCYNVGLDAHNMYPVSLEFIQEDIRIEVQRRMAEIQKSENVTRETE